MPSDIPNIDSGSLPSVTRDQMREVDRLMIEEYGIQLPQMMENAGLQLARLTQEYLDGLDDGRRVLVLAGRGNNGGGGLVAARRLAAWGADVAVVLATALDAVEAYRYSNSTSCNVCMSRCRSLLKHCLVTMSRSTR